MADWSVGTILYLPNVWLDIWWNYSWQVLWKISKLQFHVHGRSDKNCLTTKILLFCFILFCEAKVAGLMTVAVGSKCQSDHLDWTLSWEALAQSDPELTKRELLAQDQGERRGDVNKDRRDIVNSLVPEQFTNPPCLTTPDPAHDNKR